MQLRKIHDFSQHHSGEVYLTHRWQKHVYLSSSGALIVPVYNVPAGQNRGVTHIYRSEDRSGTFEHATTLSDADIPEKGDLNAGIVVEDDNGTLYATGHSNPPPTKRPVKEFIDRIPKVSNYVWHVVKSIVQPLKTRTNVLYRSTDDGRSWSVLRNRTDQDRDSPPHPHNAFWDHKAGKLWWLVGHDGVRLQRYDPEGGEWTDAYSGTVIESQDRLPLAMERQNDRLWLACEITGPDERQLFYSEDGGDSWSQVDRKFCEPSGTSNDGLWNFAFEAEGQETMYVSGGRVNYGRSFVDKINSSGEWDRIYTGEGSSEAWVNSFDDHLFVADGDGLVAHSTGSGETFNMVERFPPQWNERYDRFVNYGIKRFGERTYVVGKSALYSLE